MFTLRRVMIGLVVLIAAIQFIPVSYTNPPAADPVVFTDPKAEQIAKKACYDCHSNETVWPWYSKVAPFSWYVLNHVAEGRSRLNFSDVAATLAQTREFGPEAGEPVTAADLTEEAADTINEGEMPPAYYTLIHADAKLTAEEKSVLIAGINDALLNQK